jgi:Mor family transcriptional regulator
MTNKIDNLTVQGIRNDKAAHMKQCEIARKYRVSVSAVSRILRGNRRAKR